MEDGFDASDFKLPFKLVLLPPEVDWPPDCVEIPAPIALFGAPFCVLLPVRFVEGSPAKRLGGNIARRDS